MPKVVQGASPKAELNNSVANLGNPVADSPESDTLIGANVLLSKSLDQVSSVLDIALPHFWNLLEFITLQR